MTASKHQRDNSLLSAGLILAYSQRPDISMPHLELFFQGLRIVQSRQSISPATAFNLETPEGVPCKLIQPLLLPRQHLHDSHVQCYLRKTHRKGFACLFAMSAVFHWASTGAWMISASAFPVAVGRVRQALSGWAPHGQGQCVPDGALCKQYESDTKYQSTFENAGAALAGLS